jgi:hypothetical protein
MVQGDLEGQLRWDEVRDVRMGRFQFSSQPTTGNRINVLVGARGRRYHLRLRRVRPPA